MSITCTSYTDQLLTKKVTTATDFLKLCLRNFGVLCHLREEALSSDIPKTLEHDNRHAKQAAAAREELDTYLKMTDEEWKAKLDARIVKAKADAEAKRKEIEEADAILIPIRDQIKAWDCGEDYMGVKKFALDQIDMTIPNDFTRNYYPNSVDRLSAMTVEEFKNDHIESSRTMVKMWEEDAEREAEENKKSDKFLAGFYQNLSKLEGK